MTTQNTSPEDAAPISEEARAQALRTLCRRIGSQIIAGMAYRDADFAAIGERLGQSEKVIRRYVHRLIEGKPVALRVVSDLAFALDLTPHFSLEEIHHAE